MIISPIPSTAVAHVFSTRATAQNVTTGDGRVGWVSTGSGRSTSDILWSCFSILLVCTWKCIHFNVPSIDESEARWHRWGILCWPGERLLLRWMYKVGWMIGIVLAPEIGVAIAMDQCLRAREGLKDLKVKKDKTKVDESKEVEPKEVELKGYGVKVDVVGRDEITKTHTFFANMGGFVAKICVLLCPQHDRTSSNKFLRDEISPGGTSSIPEGESPITEEFICYISACEDLEVLLERFPDLRLPAEKDIQGLSKADAFTKTFACVQSIWLAVQSIARVSQGLPITQLELATMAFVVCALIMYILWWDKPFGVERRTVLTAITYYRREDVPLLQTSLSKVTCESDLTWGGFLQMAVRSLSTFGGSELREVVYAFGGMIGHTFGRPNPIYPPRNITNSITLYATGTLFSAFHIGAWNWEFPSSIVRTLWRTSALTATGTGPAALFLVFFYTVIIYPYFHHRVYSFIQPIILALLSLLALIYIISRLALIVLIFYCFSSMPAGVYKTVDWTKFLPHFS